MPTASHSASPSFARIDSRLLSDLALSDLDIRILGVMLCKVWGNLNGEPQVSTRELAAALGRAKRDVIVESLRNLDRLGIAVKLEPQRGKTARFRLRVEDYLAQKVVAERGPLAEKGGHQTVTGVVTTPCSEAPAAEAEPRSRSEDASTAEGGDHALRRDLDSALAQEGLSGHQTVTTHEAPVASRVGEGIAPYGFGMDEACEHLNNVGGPFFDQTEAIFRALVAERGEQAFIDAVYLLGLRLERNMPLKRAHEAWLRTAIRDQYAVTQADRGVQAARARERRIHEEAEDLEAMKGWKTLEDVPEDIRDAVAALLKKKSDDEDALLAAF